MAMSNYEQFVTLADRVGASFKCAGSVSDQKVPHTVENISFNGVRTLLHEQSD
jgi:hypothetical protein